MFLEWKTHYLKNVNFPQISHRLNAIPIKTATSAHKMEKKKKKKLQQVIALGQMWQVSMERKGLRDSQDTTEDNQGLALVDIKPHNH